MDQIYLSLITGIFIGGTAGFLGTLMLPKKMTLSADPLSHLALPGVALALVYDKSVWLGAFPFVFVGIFLIWFFERKTILSFEALTAVIFSTSIALAFLFLPIEKAEEALIGDILKISFNEMILALILSLIILFIAEKIYKKTTLINISEELAISQKINVSKYNLIYLILVGTTVVLGVKMVGGLLTSALVAIPAVTSRNISKNLVQFKIIAVILGILSSVLGIYLSQITLLPAGPLIIIVGAVIFLLSAIKKNYFKV
jgi:ABC-type Mn2+/Zn2+ transport system permease subunit